MKDTGLLLILLSCEWERERVGGNEEEEEGRYGLLLLWSL